MYYITSPSSNGNFYHVTASELKAYLDGNVRSFRKPTLHTQQTDINVLGQNGKSYTVIIQCANITSLHSSAVSYNGQMLRRR